jgi:hypothetical protein
MSQEVAKEGILDNIQNTISGSISGAKDAVFDNGVVKKGSEAFSASTEIVSKAVSNISVENTKDAIMNAMSDSSSSLYLIIFLLFLAAIVCYILYYIITDSLLTQQKILIPGTEMPVVCTELSAFPFKQKLESGNGKKRSYSFWIYVFDLAPSDGQYRHVAHITASDKKYAVQKSSIHIVLDSRLNKLHVRFALASDNEEASAFDTAANNIEETPALGKKEGLTDYLSYASNSGTIATGFSIKYIPIQRWVHVAFVLNDIGGGSITTYIDGNFVNTIDNSNRGESDEFLADGARIDINRLSLEHSGALYVGGEHSSDTLPMGFSGLISKFTINNYDLNRNDIYKEYSAGPLKGVLASMGLSSYGIRNPIYKLSASQVQLNE